MFITAADYVMQSSESDIKSPLWTGLGLMVLIMNRIADTFAFVICTVTQCDSIVQQSRL